MTDNYETVAKQVGTTPAAIERRVTLILTENNAAWTAASMSSDNQASRATRIAARQLMTEKRKIAASGCVPLSGCFIASPPYKDWAKMAYRKMNDTLTSLQPEAIDSLVSEGAIVVYEPSETGFNRKANLSLVNKTEFTSGMTESTVIDLPKGAVAHEGLGIHYYIVADKNMPKYPSGDDNYRYGAARPSSEPERTCLFLGSIDGGEPRVYEIKFSGQDALEQQPTFLPGVIPIKEGKDAKNGNGRCWTRKGVSVFTEDPDAASVLPDAPFTAEGTGFMATILGADNLLKSFNDLVGYYDAHRDDADWWDKTVGLVGEVSHIDTLDNGASTLIIGDLDDFTAPSVEVKIPAAHSHLLDFSVGSTIFLNGGVWKTNDGEPRMSVHGWFIVDGIAPTQADTTGWDA